MKSPLLGLPYEATPPAYHLRSHPRRLTAAATALLYPSIYRIPRGLTIPNLDKRFPAEPRPAESDEHSGVSVCFVYAEFVPRCDLTARSYLQREIISPVRSNLGDETQSCAQSERRIPYHLYPLHLLYLSSGSRAAASGKESETFQIQRYTLFFNRNRIFRDNFRTCGLL